MTLAPVIALSHGGGPMPILGDPGHASITNSLKTRVPKLLGLGTPSQPRAIVLVTAHWQTDQPTISSNKSHSLLYDYYNFPPEAYQIKYPAPGDPDVAREVKAALEAEGLEPELDGQRGWDHGVFIPMLLVAPEAKVPIVQVSVLESEDAETHLRMGAALAKLRESNIAIVGSGFASLHNLRTMFQLMASEQAQSAFRPKSDAWNKELTGAVGLPTRAERTEKLKGWRQFPHANDMHPRDGGEHFMPLLVCAGAAKDGEAMGKYIDGFVGLDIFTYYWGAEL
ncbi:4,5-DOPA dioxygenase extradiol [Paramyrothecium foliicola]|nr:4,5-DOPA dioxygenase extradiol [Paramyrothecium foliicola]